MNDQPPDDLVQAARAVLDHAYAPYSNFRVAAAIRTEDGSIFSGTNVEIASYGLTMCAERTAIFQAAALGHRKILECLVYTPTETATSPCGACRQVLREFAEPKSLVIWGTWKSGHRRWLLDELLPESFGPDSLT